MPGVEDSLEVLVFGLLGPGSRGRPRVTADVTKIIQQESLKVLAAFVGIVDDQAVQESLPGEALHEMADNLLFPLLQVRNFLGLQQHAPLIVSSSEHACMHTCYMV